MLMTVQLAWRSVWRHKRRTLITVSSIVFGLVCAVFIISLADGVYNQMVNDAVRMQAGHITLEHPEYRKAPAADLWIGQAQTLRRRLDLLPGVERTKLLVSGQGVAKSGSGALGVSLMGIEPAAEMESSPLAQNIKAGAYLADRDGPLAVIGAALARRLKLEVGKKLVITTNDAGGALVEELCRVKGIFATGAQEIDGHFIQVPLSFARKLYGLPADSATQLGVVLTNPDEQDKLLSLIRRACGGAPPVAVHPWQEVLPELSTYIKLDRGSNLIFQGLLLFLILFTIFNTILMSVMERRREFAVMLAIGTKAGQLKRQILAEGAFMGLLGCGGGLIMGGSVSYLAQIYGIDFSRFMREGINVSGFTISTVVHARLTPGVLFGTGGLVFGATILLSCLAARRADSFSLAETLR